LRRFLRGRDESGIFWEIFLFRQRWKVGHV